MVSLNFIGFLWFSCFFDFSGFREKTVYVYGFFSWLIERLREQMQQTLKVPDMLIWVRVSQPANMTMYVVVLG